MKEVLYSERPSVFQTYENGEVQYRWDIEEVISDNEENNTSQWKCKEVTIYSPIEKEQLTQAVITSIWDNEFEKKLINDYNGAMAEIFDEETNQKYIANYNEFLTQRKELKSLIKLDWELINNK